MACKENLKAGLRPERLDFRFERANLSLYRLKRPEKADFGTKKLNLESGSERIVLRSERARLWPSRPQGGQTDGWMYNGQTYG